MPGWAQRVRRQAAESHSARSRSPPPSALPALLKSWLSGWAWGQRSATALARDADAYRECHTRIDPRILQLSKAKTNPGNAERVVEGLVSLGTDLEPIYLEQSSVEWVLLPETMFEWLETKCPRQFRVHMGASPSG